MDLVDAGNDAHIAWYHARSLLAASARFRAALLLGAAATELAGCSASTSAPLVGVSDAVPEASPKRAASPAPRPLWSELEAARAWPEAAPAAVALAHRRDGSLVHVRVEPASLDAYMRLAVDAPMSDGARVIAWHESPSGQVLDGYLLEKRAGAWSAAVIDPRGALLPGPHTACLRCHDMAPTDHLFGRRVPSRPPSPSAESTGAVPR